MGISAFQRGALVRIGKVVHRLIQRVSNVWQLKNLDTGLLVQYDLQALQRLLVDRKLVFVVPENAKPAEVINLSPEQAKLANVRLAYVRAVLELPKTAREMDPVILDVWNKCKEPKRRPSWITVYRWRKRYLGAGRDIRALLDYSSRKGNRKSRFPEEVTTICNEAIDDVFLTRERGTVQDTCNEAILRIREANLTRPAVMALPLPTLTFIKRLIGQIPEFDKCAARDGREAARRRFRWVKGHHVTEGPLQRVEMDHTLLDLCVLDDETCLPLGRPWVTACIDDYSRCILGIYVGFVAPSCLSISKCLKNAFLPKVQLRDEYPNIKHDWPAHGVMRELVVDNGLEFHSQALTSACQTLDITICFSARQTPWSKGKIERWFGTLNRDFAHKIPGTTFSNVLERGDYNPEENAVVSLSTFNKAIREWICDVYHQRPHRALQMSPDQMWLSSISPDDINVPHDVLGLDLVLGRPDSRKLTHKGIELEGLFYNSNEVQELLLRYGGSLKVEIRVDESDIGHIFVISPNSRDYFTVPALDLEYANGISRWQHKKFRERAGECAYSDDSLGWLEAKNDIARSIENDFAIRPKVSRKDTARHKEHSLRSIATQTRTPREPSAPGHPASATGPQAEQAILVETHTDNNESPPVLKRRSAPIFQMRQRNG